MRLIKRWTDGQTDNVRWRRLRGRPWISRRQTITEERVSVAVAVITSLTFHWLPLVVTLDLSATSMVSLLLLRAADAVTVDSFRAWSNVNPVHTHCLLYSAKLHYTDTGYGHVVQHHQRTSSQQLYNLLYNKFTTSGQKFATSQHFDMSRCWALRCSKFVVQQVVELLWACPLVEACPLVVLYITSVAVVRVVEFGTMWQFVYIQPTDLKFEFIYFTIS